jgi:hypothetical protein
MTASRSLSRGPAIAGPAGLGRQTSIGIARAVAASLGGVLACVGGILVVRRLFGGFAVTPGPVAAWGVAAAGGLLLVATDLAARLGEDSWPRWLARGGFVLAALAMTPVGDGLSPGPRAAAAAAVATALLTALPGLPLRQGWPEGSGWRAAGVWRWRAAKRPPGNPMKTLPPGPASGLAAPEPRQPGAGRAVAWQEPAAAGLRQRLERFETAGGEDCLRGQVMLPIAAGSRVGHAHVGFCPPFTSTPAVEVASECDVVEVAVSAAEVLPWGVRVECRLSEPAEEPLAIAVDLVARNPA